MQAFPLRTPWPARALVWCLSLVVGLGVALALVAGVGLAGIGGVVLLIEGNLLGLALLALAVLPLLVLRYHLPSSSRPSEPLAVGRVAIGSDGIAVHRLTRTRFIPWSRVREVDRLGGDRVAVRFDGGVERVRVADARALERVVSEGLARRESVSRSAAIRLLEPDGDIDESWMRRAKGLVGEPAYRVESVDEAAVLAVLEDADQRPMQRIGAALALSGSSGSTSKRVRIAIEDTVEPELSQALRAAEAGDLDPGTLRRVARKLTND